MLIISQLFTPMLNVQADTPNPEEHFTTAPSSYGGVKITNYTGPIGTKVVIPSTINGDPVVEISGFNGRRIPEVVIPDGVKIIGNYAFAANELKQITIPNSVEKINMGAFQDNKLTHLTIPSNVTSISSYAFSKNELKTVIIPDSVTSIGESAFEINQLTSVIIPKNLKWISPFVFRSNRLMSVTIPEGVEIIDRGAFSYNELTNVTIPASVTTLWSAFDSNKLKRVEFKSSSTVFYSNPFIQTSTDGFIGWFTDSEHTQPWDESKLTIPDGKILYGKWGPEYTVTFESNGGTTLDSTFVMQDNPGSVTKPTNPIKAGYVFEGWYTDNDTFQNEYDFSTTVTADITLYAKWAKEGIATSTTEGIVSNDETPVFIDNTITVKFSSLITGAQVTTTSINPNTDFLSYDSSITTNITGTYDPDMVTLTFTGTATDAEYQAVLRSVRFQTTDYNSIYSGEKRSFTFSIDGYSEWAYRTFNIVDPIQPTVTTSLVVSNTGDTADVEGEVTNLGLPNPKAHGFVWGTSENPTIDSNDKYDVGSISNAGTFNYKLTELAPAQQYYVRAYATNSAGTAYGENVSFYTNPAVPSLTFGTLTATSVPLKIVTNGNANAEYLVERSSDGETWTTVQEWDTTINLIDNSGKVTDFYRVKARNMATPQVESAYSNVISAFAGGEGTLEKPYLISTKEHLNNLRSFLNNSNVHFKLTENITFEPSDFEDNGVFYNEGKGWEPIGTENEPFNGKFYGNGKTISGLKIDRVTEENIGFFGYVDQLAEISNVKLENVNVKGLSYVGGLVGYNEGSISSADVAGVITGNVDDSNSERIGGLVGQNEGPISNSSFDGNVTGVADVGGLVGYNSQGTISESFATGEVTGTDGNTGGLVGDNYNGTINNSSSTGNVTGTDYVGGLIGSSYDGTISNSYATGTVTGDDYGVGGLVGSNSTTISNSYATGKVIGDINSSYTVGGLVGYNDDTISNSYATGNVMGGYMVGGLVGDNEGQINTSYASGNVNGNENEIQGLYDTNENGNIGGLIGYNKGEVDNSYALGNVKGYKNVGGLVGSNGGNLWNQNYLGTISNSYAVGTATGTDENIGGFVGYNHTDSTITNSFWDKETSATLTGVASGDTEGVSGKTTEEMKTKGTFADWDFASPAPIYWTIVDNTTHMSYPYFAWMNSAPNWNDSKAPGYIAKTTDSNNGSDFAGGLGTDTNPYKIATKEQLNKIRDNVNAYYKLTANIEFTPADFEPNGAFYNNGKGWAPILEFKGVFDGNNKSISGLTINRGNESQIGFFSILSKDAKIINAQLVDVQVIGNSPVGGLVGTNNGTIENSAVSGSVKGLREVGGLVGHATGIIKDSHASANVKGEGLFNGQIGGLVGTIGVIDGVYNGKTVSMIDNSYATGTVEGEYNVGGLAGRADLAEILNSYATGSVKGNSGVGGLAGSSQNSEITNTYASGNVEGNSGAGGLLGVHAGQVKPSILKDSYATGNVKGNASVGGLIGNYDNNNVMGEKDKSKVVNSYATGTVEGIQSIGGLIGRAIEGNIIQSFATGNVSGNGNGADYESESDENIYAMIGGLVGSFENGQINNAFATGAVTGTAADDPTIMVFVGGLVGGLTDSAATSKIINSHSVGVVKGIGEVSVGGFVGKYSPVADNVIMKSFWDKDTSTTAKGIGLGSSEGIVGASVNDMKVLSAFTTADWNKDGSIWTIVSTSTHWSYPYFTWMKLLPNWSDSKAPGYSLKPTNNDGGPSSTSTTPSTNIGNTTVIVNGKEESIGKSETTTVNNQTKTTLTIDETQLQERLEAEGNNATVTIPVTDTKADVIIGQLNGQMVKNMENKQATVIVQTSTASYTLPASQINIDAIAQQLGQNISLQDIKINIEIAKPQEETVKVVENAAQQGSFSIMVPPVNFKVMYTSGDKTGEVTSFNAYVERTIAIPDGVDPNKITTGIVVSPDGTTYHVPTQVIQINGKYYAKINSLTNSTYSVIWNPREFKDVAKHWAKDSINNLGSRMIIKGINENAFAPNQDITRAQFAAIIVRALGLKPGMGEAEYSDVAQTAWYVDYIQTATEYKLIKGYENGEFGPNDKITRQQAIAIMARAMTLTKLNVDLSDKEVNAILAKYSDAKQIAGYAKENIALAIQTGVVNGRSNQTIAPSDYITRAEVATIVERFLKKSELID